MRTIRTKVYQFSELNKPAQEKAINWFLNSFDDSLAWDDIKQDAKEIGLNILRLDTHRRNDGYFNLSAHEVAANIIRDHGGECETYKTAQSFLDSVNEIQSNYPEMEGEEYESKMIEAEDDFLQSLLEDYRIMLNHQIEYEQSEEFAIENIEANEYEFKADGTRF